MSRTKNIKYVMDASAIVAVACGEPCLPELPQMFMDSVITTINLAEALTAIIKKTNANPEMIWDSLSNYVHNHYPADDVLTYEVVKMFPIAKPHGLSFGDRYCLALAKTLQLPVYTADRVWKKLEKQLDISINLIR